MRFMKIDRARIFEYLSVRFKDSAPLTSAQLDNIKHYSVQKSKDEIVLIGQFEVQTDDLDSTMTITKDGIIKIEYFMYGIPVVSSSRFKIVDVYEAVSRDWVSIVLGQVNAERRPSPNVLELDDENTIEFIARNITFDFSREWGFL